jgi:hypothetical protein
MQNKIGKLTLRKKCGEVGGVVADNAMGMERKLRKVRGRKRIQSKSNTKYGTDQRKAADSALSNEADAVGSHLLLGNTRQQTVAE